MMTQQRNICLNVPSATVDGRYKFIIHSPRTGTRECFAEPSPNIFTDYGLNRMGTAITNLYCHVGTGTAAAVVSDTTLQTWVASTLTTVTSTNTAQGSSPYFSTYIVKFRFATGAVVGNMSEVGISPVVTNTNMMSRALIVDGGGLTTSITVLSDETLDVEFSFRVYPPTSDITGSIVLGGVTYDYVLRSANITDGTTSWNASVVLTGMGGSPAFVNAHRVYDGSIGAITAVPSGSADNTSPTVASYSNNSLYRDVTETADLGVGNFAAFIKSAMIAYSLGMRYQISFTPVIPKDATKSLTLTFRFSWARH